MFDTFALLKEYACAQKRTISLNGDIYQLLTYRQQTWSRFTNVCDPGTF